MPVLATETAKHRANFYLCTLFQLNVYIKYIGNTSVNQQELKPVHFGNPGVDLSDRAPTRALHVADILRERILSGALQPGTPLQELPLAMELGMSRTPVRAALGTLAQEGLIAYLPQRGYQVHTWTLDDVMGAYEVRGIIEAAACARAATLGLDEPTLALLERCLTEVDEMLGVHKLPDGGLERWRELNIAFHKAILDSAGNPFFASALQSVRSIPLVVNAVVVWREPADLRAFHDDHHRIFDAIRRRQPDRASYLMKEHIYRAAEAIRQNYEDRNAPAPSMLRDPRQT